MPLPLITKAEGPVSLAFGPPTLALSGSVSIGATALPVASGGTAFASGQLVLIQDAGANVEMVKVAGTPTGTSIPVTACTKAHPSGAIIALCTVSGAGVAPQSPYVQS